MFKSSLYFVARSFALIIFITVLQVSQVVADHVSYGCSSLSGYDNLTNSLGSYGFSGFEFYAGEEVTIDFRGTATQVTAVFPTQTVVIHMGTSFTYVVTTDGIMDFTLYNYTSAGWIDFTVYCLELPGSHEESSEENPSPAFHDGRLNDFDTGNPVVLYTQSESDDNWHLDVYAADESGLLFTVSAETINAVEACPESNTLIYEDTATGITFWRLAEESDGTCPFQLNAPMDEPGKWYIINFYEPQANRSYESWTEFIGN